MNAIRYRDGDLLKAPETVIGHGCNALGVMGAGVAKKIREVYPGAYQAYRDKFERDGLVLGEVIPWTGPNRVVLNCITQETYGNTPGTVYADYTAIRDCMRRIEKAAKRHQANGAGALHEHREIAFPRIGAGFAGGDWDTIAAIIESEIQSLTVTVYTK
jgi:Predicted phosphatase homologous to the C-terminal domain of histone macroH2A1